MIKNSCYQLVASIQSDLFYRLAMSKFYQPKTTPDNMDGEKIAQKPNQIDGEYLPEVQQQFTAGAAMVRIKMIFNYK